MNRSFAACISMPPGGLNFRAVFAITLIGVPIVFQPPSPLRLFVVQAKAVWQLFNYAENLATMRGRTLLRVNLDETAVCLHPGQGKGAIFVTKGSLRAGCGQRVPKWKRRCYMTHIGIVCDRSGVQAALPQFLVANERTLKARSLAALAGACPPNVTLLRQTSAWNNTALTRRVVRAVAAAIARQRESLGDVQVVLFMDCAKIHLHASVLRACKAAGVWLIVIPPHTTGHLQPLDTHVFALFKSWLIHAYQEARTRSRSANGDLDMDEFLPCVYDAIRSVLEGRTWADAFAQDGFGARQSALCESLKRRLGLEQPAHVPVARPSDAQLQVLFPRRWKVPTALYWFIVRRASLTCSRSSSRPSGRWSTSCAQACRGTGAAYACRASTSSSCGQPCSERRRKLIGHRAGAWLIGGGASRFGCGPWG